MKISRAAVKDDSVAEIGYDPTSRVLEVLFHPQTKGKAGAIWRYEPVAKEVYGAMLLPGARIGRILALNVLGDTKALAKAVLVRR